MTSERIIDYVLPVEDEAAAPQVLRLVISEMNTVQHARWLRYQRETTQWATDVLGIATDDPEGEEQLSADVSERRERGFRRAAMLGALKRVEIGTSAADEEEPSAWQNAELPKEWQTIDGFIDELPWKLFNLWLALAAECNPGAFFREVETDEKKSTPGHISVRSSMKRLTIS